MEPLPYIGRTSQFFRESSKRVLKPPTKLWKGSCEDEFKTAFRIEAQILEKLGHHPRTVPYHGMSGNGIVLSEASHGNLQKFIDSRNGEMHASLRWRLAEQAAEAITHMHKNGVIHSDLRPENFLVHDSGTRSADGLTLLDLWLCDFRGSTCKVPKLDGGHMPDTPFFDPRITSWESKPATDIFSLGSIIYAIMTGYWPFRTSPPPSAAEAMDIYRDEVDKLFGKGTFPDTSGLQGGDVIRGCWEQCCRSTE
ncbi:kinase-like domain-containing protein [Massariosphaeria phaeospora]|uniref:EKC/KEOPS complex subunit BUD32 n=1 Tax=Massariosphaeria phaeospora TaxID=100035 RepID=A0A7C8I7E5_9PLEO|nr:kinase-like domain-containing protein [Massariosphaeria phaeospora]